MMIRKAHLEDLAPLYSLFQQVIKPGDVYVFDQNTSVENFQHYWFAPENQTFVREENGQITGSYFLRPNQPGRGAHIANASYMVDQNSRGRGIGDQLCRHSIETAKATGYEAIQFNIVVSTNEAAIHVWQKNGFKVIGTIPKGFDHAKLGKVDALIMHRKLDD